MVPGSFRRRPAGLPLAMARQVPFGVETRGRGGLPESPHRPREASPPLSESSGRQRAEATIRVRETPLAPVGRVAPYHAGASPPVATRDGLRIPSFFTALPRWSASFPGAPAIQSPRAPPRCAPVRAPRGSGYPAPGAGAGRREPAAQIQVRALAEDDGSLDHILELTHVAWPRVGLGPSARQFSDSPRTTPTVVRRPFCR